MINVGNESLPIRPCVPSETNLMEVPLGSEEELAVAIIFSSFPNEPVFHLLMKDALRAFAFLQEKPSLQQRVIELLGSAQTGTVSAWKAHEQIASLRLLYDENPQILDNLEDEQGSFQLHLREAVSVILKRHTQEYLRNEASVAALRLYGAFRLKTVSLPLFVARWLICRDGSLNLGLAGPLKELCLPRKEERDGVEAEIAVGLQQLCDDDEAASAIESLCLPLSSFGERVVRATLALESTEEVTPYHLRQVCCASFLTWIRQLNVKDCYAKAFLAQLQRASFQFFFDDFRMLMQKGSVERLQEGTAAAFFPLETVPALASTRRIQSSALRDILKLPSVKLACKQLDADEQAVCTAVKSVKGQDDSLCFKDLFETLTQDRRKLATAFLYLEAPGHTIVHQMLENAMVSQLVHPGTTATPTPDYGERIEMAWLKVIDSWVIHTLKEASEAAVVKQCQLFVRQHLRLLFSPSHCSLRAEPVWTICRLHDGTIIPLESKEALGEFLVEVVGKECSMPSLTAQGCAESFFQECRLFLNQMTHEGRLSNVVIVEHPLCFPSCGHRIAAVVSRYFGQLAFSYTEIPCDGEAVVRWAEEAAQKYGREKELSFCARSDSHAFRLLPSVCGQQEGVHRVMEQSKARYKMSWDLCVSSPALQQIIGHLLAVGPALMEMRDARTIEMVMADVQSRSSPGDSSSDRSLLVVLSLLEPWHDFSGFNLLQEAIQSICHKQRARKAIAASAQETVTLAASWPSSTPMVSVIGEMTRLLAAPLLPDEMQLAVGGITKMVRDTLVKKAEVGQGLLLPIGDSNYRANVGGAMQNGLDCLWYNPQSQKWDEVLFWGFDGFAVSRQTSFRIVGLVQPLVAAFQRQSQLRELRRHRKIVVRV